MDVTEWTQSSGVDASIKVMLHSRSSGEWTDKQAGLAAVKKLAMALVSLELLNKQETVTR